METAAQHFTRTFWRPGTRRASTCWGAASRSRTLERLRVGRGARRLGRLLGAARKFPPALLAKAGLVVERQGKEGTTTLPQPRRLPILSESGPGVPSAPHSLDASRTRST